MQVRPSSNAPGSTEQGVYFLDGLGSNPEYSSWVLPAAGAVDTYSTSYNLVMPAGGAGQWMTNWQQAPTGASTAPQWDTFVGEELPGYLADNFDIGTTNNAIVGVSMSGAPARPPISPARRPVHPRSLVRRSRHWPTTHTNCGCRW